MPMLIYKYFSVLPFRKQIRLLNRKKEISI